MPVPPLANPKVATPIVQVIQADTTTSLATLVNVATNTLVKQYQSPASGQTAGDVLNNSIEVDPVIPIVVNNVPIFNCSIRYIKMVTPS